MVHQKVDASSSVVKRQRLPLKGAMSTLFLLILFLSGPLINTIKTHQQAPGSQDEAVIPVSDSSTPEKIDLQTTIDDWEDTITGTSSVLIYDLDRDEIAGAHNSSENYNMNSLYKLFVVYEGYQRILKGEWNQDDTLECLDLAIRESNSVCAEELWAKIGEEELDDIVKNQYKIANTEVSSFSSNSEDITSIMKLFYYLPKNQSEPLAKRMKDSFLNQPVTTYDWRQGLPNGFKEANVYNKVGWEYNADLGVWETYHDAAIIEFPTINRHFIIVVMTSHVASEDISRLGSLIENKVLISTKEL